MKAKLTTFKIDVICNKVEVSVALEKGGYVGIHTALPTPGDMTESQMKSAGLEAALTALQHAKSALEA